MNAANAILQSLRDFGWPLLLYAIFAPIAIYIVPGNTREDRVAKLLFAGAIIAIIEAFFFIGVESGDIWQVMRIHRLWGLYTITLTIVGLVLCARYGLRVRRENRKVINLYDLDADAYQSGDQRIRVLNSFSVAIWLLAFIVAVIWLFRIAASR